MNWLRGVFSKPSVILSYGVAVGSIVFSVVILLWMQNDLGGAAHVSVFLCAVMFATWFGGVGPGLLATTLSGLTFGYYFIPPTHTLAFEITQLPPLVLFGLSALIIVSISGALMRTTELLKHSEEAIRRSEDNLRLVINTIPALVWSAQPDGSLDFINQRLTEFTGLTLDDVRGWQWPSFFHPEDQGRLMGQVRTSLATGEPLEAEARLQRTQGDYRWLLIRSVPLRDESGKIVRWIGTKTDITERKQAEDALRASMDQLHALAQRLEKIREEEKEVIAREIHDEFGQTLTAIRMGLSLLSERIQSGEKLSQESIQAELRSSMKLVDHAVRSIQSIATELRPWVLDSLDLSGAIQWQAREFGERTGIECSVNSTPENIELDRESTTAVFRIFQETLTNIARHAKTKKVDVVLKSEYDNLMLDVRDYGIGLSKEKSTAPESLGIQGMKERAFLLGGDMQISGSQDGGTIVTLTVPLHRSTEKALSQTMEKVE
jgi:PAS domain S-box-containing protein